MGKYTGTRQLREKTFSLKKISSEKFFTEKEIAPRWCSHSVALCSSEVTGGFGVWFQNELSC